MKYDSREVSTEIANCNILKIVVKQNGIQGGDAGHGGYVSIDFINQADTCMEINGEETDKISITFRGDTERATLIAGLKFIIDELINYPTMNIKEFK